MTLLDDYALFHSRLENRYKEVSTQDNLTRVRAKAWDRLNQIGFPNRKTPDFKPLRLRTIYNHPLSLPSTAPIPSLPPTTTPRIVFINGKYSEQHSSLDQLPAKIVLKPLNEAMSDYASLLNGKSFATEDNAFTLINSACQQDGLFLYVPPKVYLSEPIQIIHLVTADNALLLPKLSLYLGSQADLRLEFETLYQNCTAPFVNGLFDLNLEEGAKLHLTELLTNTPDKAIHFHANRAALKQDASLKSIYLTNGAAISRNDFLVSLNGENAETHLSGLWVLRKRLESHQHISVIHNAPNTRSMQLFKGVLHDDSHSSFDGKIIVDRLAQKTEAYQLNNNLILSPSARAETKPNLKIFADDVKASHGATVGELDEDQLFYLLTRGIPKKEAQEILIHGFCEEVVKLVPYASLKRIIEAWE